jgi:predicted DNA-binding transcriptional regulator YafY
MTERYGARRTAPVRNWDKIGAVDAPARMLRLLGLLQRRPVSSGSNLAEQLGVTTRTLRRDVNRLRELGYAVDAIPGPDGGYRLGVGADLPPLLLGDDEAMAVAVALGLSAGAAVGGIEEPALAALAKLDRLLPPRLRGQLGRLQASTVALVHPAESVAIEDLVGLAHAVDSHQRVTFGYRAADGRRSERRAEPYRLVATDRRWYLVAYDLDRNDWRTFRVDRLSGLQVTGHTFAPRELADPARLVAEAITTAPYRYQAVIHIQATPAQIARHIPATVGIVRPAGDQTELELGGDDLEWLAGRLVGLGFPFEVKEPPELRDYLSALGARLRRAHRVTTTSPRR